MATHLKLSLDTRRKDRKYYPIIFRLSHNRKTTSISSGQSVKLADWDDKNRKVRSSCKEVESPARLNNLLVKKLAGMVDILTKLEDKQRLKYMSLSEVRESITQSASTVTFFRYTQSLIDELIESERIGNARVYRDTLNAVKKFRKNHDFGFDELNVEFLNRFEKWHLLKGNSLGGLSVYLRTIRAINRKAINAGIADQEGYAFAKYAIRNGKPRKRAILANSIKKIWQLTLDKNTTLYRDRNIFMISFFLNGMSYVDMAHLKLSNIIDGRIKYTRQKTGEPYDIKIHDQLDPLLSFFTRGKAKTEYLLPIIKSKEPTVQYKEVLWARKRYNRNLKTLAEMAGIEEKLTSYVARHSFASGADDMGIPITAISQMLGHKSIKTTQSYLAGLRKSKIDEYQDQIINNLSDA